MNDTQRSIDTRATVAIFKSLCNSQGLYMIHEQCDITSFTLITIFSVGPQARRYTCTSGASICIIGLYKCLGTIGKRCTCNQVSTTFSEGVGDRRWTNIEKIRPNIHVFLGVGLKVIKLLFGFEVNDEKWTSKCSICL